MLIITAAERLESPCRRFRSIIDYIVINDLCGSLTDVVHLSNPILNKIRKVFKP